MTDLFNLDRALTPAERRSLTRKSPRPRGHIRPPGTGPAGETCKTCKHIARVESGARRIFRKCGLAKAIWTHGPGSDIRASDPACERWEKAE